MTIDQFLELAKTRRSVRRFKPDPVPEDCVKKILEAARWAMSGANGQPWEFIVVTDDKTKNELFEAGRESTSLSMVMEMSRMPEMRQPWYRDLPHFVPRSRFSEAPVLIIVCGDPRTAQASVINRVFDRRWVVDENIAACTQMIHLAVAACGLGSQWVTIDRYFEELIKPILGVPLIYRIFNMVPIGYPAAPPKQPYRRELSEFVHYGKYDMSKYRSHEAVQEFIRGLRIKSEIQYPTKIGD